MTKDLDKLTIESVRFENEKVIFDISDGGLIGCPIAWFPRLANASEEQRNNWKLISRKQGVEWEEIDEHLSLKGMFSYCPE